MMQPKTILCYGDSNTWGWNPVGADLFVPDRFPSNVRWTGVLQAALGVGYTVLEEGLSGRTTVFEDPVFGYKNGKEQLIPCLETHRPLDLVIILLGTNDLKKMYGVSPMEIAFGAGALVDMARHSRVGPAGRAPRVLLIAPPPPGKLTGFAEMFEGAEDKAARFGECYAQVAVMYGCAFLNAGEIVVSSDLDGLHWEASEHEKFGQALAGQVRDILSGE
ncbi:hydrolase [Capsulimonas corticalis]|uniref:Hydrolase n=1 Tax=Capsulimonas corticalis TaxID=2219043 RepID=A0A402CV41_9BACT|nr:SGNH/GDSL hydrolase family protein [Capsulimonas corticalis]BDI30278.1 hydrolase [Capsulimonas corticalis]